MTFIRLKGIKDANGTKTYYAYIVESRWVSKLKSSRQIVKAYIGKFAVDSLTADMTRKILARDNMECVFCKQRTNLVLDHKTPILKGGNNQEDNLQVLCSTCNKKKGVLTQEEYNIKYNL